MTGSLQEKQGVYYAVLNVYVNGKRKQKWINTGFAVKGNNKRKALQELNRLLATNGEPSPARAGVEMEIPVTETLLQADSDIPFYHDYLAEWLRKKKKKIGLSTWEGYDTYVRVHLIPYFRELGLRINEITSRHIKDYVDFKFEGGRADGREDGLSIASLKKHKSILGMTFKEAMVDQLVDRNPVEVVSLPCKDDAESIAVFLTAEEANTMMQAFRGHELQPLVFTALCYGLRKSEALGLKWNAVDFTNNTLRIQHTVVKNKTLIIGDKTKTKAGKGTYQLLPEVKEILLQLRQEQEVNKKAYGKAWQDTGYIFVHPDGSLRRPDCVTRGFQRVLANHGLKKMRFHDLRHSCASVLHDKGWDLRDIQDWLRHADVETTANIYTHISDERKTKMARDMEGTFHL